MRVSFRAVALLGAVAAVALVATAAFLLVRSGRDTAERRLVSLTAQGFTLQPGGFSVAYAFVAKNNSDSHALTNVHFEITFRDPEGNIVADREGTLNFLPGQEVAIGASSHLLRGRPDAVTMAVTLTGGTLEAPPSVREGFSLAPVEGALLVESGRVHTLGSIISPFEAFIRYNVSVVLYDAHGAIVAGNSIVSDSYGWEMIQGTTFSFDNLGVEEPVTAVFYTMIVSPTMAEIEAVEQAAQARAVQPVTLTWEHADLPLLDRTNEPEYPFDHVTDTEMPTWRMHVVHGDGEPRQVFESPWLMSAGWREDGSVIDATVGTFLPPPGAAHSPELWRFEQAHMVFDAETLDGGEDLLIGGNVHPSPAGGAMVVAPARGEKRDLYRVEPDGSVYRLVQDWPGWSFQGWSPDGQYFVPFVLEEAEQPPAAPSFRPRRNGYLHVVPASGGPARVINAPIANYPVGVSWSPDGRSLVFVARLDIHLYDVESRDLRRLTRGAGYNWGTPGWSKDGTFVYLRGGLVDVRSGDLLAAPATAGQVRASTLSPDGRYFVNYGEPRIVGVDSRDCCWYETTYHVLDRQTNEERSLTFRGFYTPADFGAGDTWLADGRTLLIKETICCHGGMEAFSLLNASTMEVVPLMPEKEPNGRAAISPDGTRILMATGNSLRVLDASGNLLREIEVADGLIFNSVAWSPDGRSFLYVVGPRVNLL